MLRKRLIVSSLIFTMATGACTSVGKRPSPLQSCPRPSLPPAGLMVEPTTESKVSAELLAPLPSATPK